MNDDSSANDSTRAGRRPPRTRVPKPDRHFITALARGLELLACFRSGDRALSNHQLAQRTRLPKSTVSRLTATLTRLGYLIQVEHSGKYRLGTASLALGSAMLARLDVRKVARPLMQELSDFSGGTVSLGTRDRLSMIFIEHCRPDNAAWTMTLDVGSRLPIGVSAVGRAWLATASERDRSDCLAQLHALDPAAAPAVEAGVALAVADYPRLGVAVSFGDWQKDVNAIARAFDPGGGLPTMCISIGGPADHVPQDFLLDQVRPRLIAMTAELEATLPR